MLSDKIWLTRKTRIITEQRLINSNSISNYLVIWYSTILVFLTIWNLVYPDDRLNIFLALGSIAVLVVSAILIAQKYSERSYTIRNCYIKLDELYSKVKRAEQIQDTNKIQEFETEYSTILQNVENHSEFDYLCLRFNLRNDPNTTLLKFKFVDWLSLILGHIISKLFVIIYFLLPFGLGLLWIYLTKS